MTVREAIAARIDAMPPDARRALLAASVIGKTFWRGVVAAIADDVDVDGALAVLEARDLVRRDAASRLASDVQFTFKHMLVREVAYATVTRAVRREQHAAVARYVEDVLAADTLSTILAYHWREAGEPAKAVPYLLAAAETARRSWAKDSLVDLYTRALELADDEALRRHIRLQRAQALVELLDRPRAADELETLLPSWRDRTARSADLARNRDGMVGTRRRSARRLAARARPCGASRRRIGACGCARRAQPGARDARSRR